LESQSCILNRNGFVAAQEQSHESNEEMIEDAYFTYACACTMKPTITPDVRDPLLQHFLCRRTWLRRYQPRSPQRFHTIPSSRGDLARINQLCQPCHNAADGVSGGHKSAHPFNAVPQPEIWLNRFTVADSRV
jgi:hypothetical protein